MSLVCENRNYDVVANTGYFLARNLFISFTRYRETVKKQINRE